MGRKQHTLTIRPTRSDSVNALLWHSLYPPKRTIRTVLVRGVRDAERWAGHPRLVTFLVWSEEQATYKECSGEAILKWCARLRESGQVRPFRRLALIALVILPFPPRTSRR